MATGDRTTPQASDPQQQGAGVHRVVSSYALSNLLSRLFGLVYAYIKPKLLPPEAIGLWNLLRVVTDYAALADLGANAATRYRIPVLVVRGDEEGIARVKGAAFFGAFVLSAVAAVGLAALAFWPGFSMVTRVGLIAVAALVLLNWYYGYLVTLLKSLQIFKPLAVRNYLLPTIQLAIGLPLLLAFGIYGLYTTAVVSIAAMVAFLSLSKPKKPVAPFSRATFFGLVRAGLPIMLFDAGMVLLTTVDRILISFFLDMRQLGYYVIAITVGDLALRIPGAAREVIEPRMAQALAGERHEAAVEGYYLPPLYNTAYYFPFVICGAYFALPIALPWLLPRYVEGILPAQILVFGIGFLALAYATRGLVVLNRWQLPAALIELVALLVNLAVSLTLLSLGYGIGAVALGTSLSHLVLFVGLFVFLAVRLRPRGVQLAGHLLPLLAPAVVLATLLSVARVLSERGPLSGVPGIVLTAVVTLVLMFGVTLVAARRSRYVTPPWILLRQLAGKA